MNLYVIKINNLTLRNTPNLESSAAWISKSGGQVFLAGLAKAVMSN